MSFGAETTWGKKITDFGGARGLWLDLFGSKIDYKTPFTMLKRPRHRDVTLSNNIRIISRSSVISPISHRQSHRYKTLDTRGIGHFMWIINT